MFRASDVLILNKIDLLPYVSFGVDQCIAFARQVNPEVTVLQVSAETGAGMDTWYEGLTNRIHAAPAVV